MLDSQHFGVPQRRRRVFLVGGPTEARVAQILALTESGGGDSAAGGQAGQDVAYSLAASTRGTGDQHGNAWNSTYVSYGKQIDSSDRNGGPPNLLLAGTLKQRMRGATDEVMDNLVTHALTGEGHDASEDGTGRGTLLVARALKAKGNMDHREDGDTLINGSSIRRLTPLECERLQGFPEGWTCLCTPLEVYAADPDAAALACTCSDSPRYRALGNAVTVPVIFWLGQRIRQWL